MFKYKICELIMKILVYLFIFTLSSNPIFGFSVNDGKWVKQRTRTDKRFSVYTRDEKGTDIVGIKVEGILEAPIMPILMNLRKVEGSSDWTPDQKEKKTVDNLGDVAAVTYSVSDMPWPIWDRSLLLHNELYLDKERKLLFVLSRSVEHKDYSKDYSKDLERIRAEIRYSNMGFKPIGPKKTYVELTAFVDPRGSIPTWVVNFFQRKWPITFLKAIEERANKVKPEPNKGITKMLKELLSLLELDEKDYL